MHPLKLCLRQSNRLLEEFPLDQPLEVGRQRHGEPEPLGVQVRRLIITHENDGAFFHRRHLTLIPLTYLFGPQAAVVSCLLPAWLTGSAYPASSSGAGPVSAA